jgi:hypothetical protein
VKNLIPKCFSLLIFAGAVLLLFSEYRFARAVSMTTGNVISKPLKDFRMDSIGKTASGHVAYSFDYTFMANGRNYAGKGSLDSESGKFVIVYYDRSDPSHNTLTAPDMKTGVTLVVSTALIVLVSFQPWRWFRASQE